MRVLVLVIVDLPYFKTNGIDEDKAPVVGLGFCELWELFVSKPDGGVWGGTRLFSILLGFENIVADKVFS